MNLKSLLPWLCVVGLVIGLGWMYAANQKKEAELAALREDSQQLEQLRAEVEEAKTNRTQAESDELTRLRKDNEELLRLRNEVRQLRGDKQQLATQLQTAESQAQGAQAQVQALRANPGQPAALGQLSPAAQAAFAARYGLAVTNSESILQIARPIDSANERALRQQSQTRRPLPNFPKCNAPPSWPPQHRWQTMFCYPFCHISTILRWSQSESTLARGNAQAPGGMKSSSPGPRINPPSFRGQTGPLPKSRPIDGSPYPQPGTNSMGSSSQNWSTSRFYSNTNPLLPCRPTSHYCNRLAKRGWPGLSIHRAERSLATRFRAHVLVPHRGPAQKIALSILAHCLDPFAGQTVGPAEQKNLAIRVYKL